MNMEDSEFNMEGNEFNSEDFSGEEENVSGDRVACEIFARIATKFEEWINGFPFFQEHPKLAKCITFPVTGVLLLIFFLGVVVATFAKANSNNND